MKFSVRAHANRADIAALAKTKQLRIVIIGLLQRPRRR